ncbi:MAG: hypothetical protein IT445_07990 [Phycisphaeraceae bacterium]|nr:hypothetical protein [Phycisphaeraceae bacterium]
MLLTTRAFIHVIAATGNNTPTPWHESPLFLVIAAALVGVITNRIDNWWANRQSRTQTRKILLATLAGELEVIHQELNTLITIFEQLLKQKSVTITRFPYLPTEAYQANVHQLGIVRDVNLAYIIAM